MGELARRQGAPKLPETPLELLTPREGDGFSLLNKYGLPVAFGCGGVVSVCMKNFFARRPFWAGIHQHLFIGGLMFGGGYMINQLRLEYLKERDATYKHYVMLHPEDFPPFDRKRFKDLFESWTPAR